MPNLDRITVRLQSVLTRGFIRFLKRSKLEEVEEVSLLHEPITVYKIRSDGSLFGQTTPFGTIIWNKTRMEGLSKLGQRLVLRHECSHRDRNAVFKGVFLGTTVAFAAGLKLLLTGALALFFGASLTALVPPMLVALGMMGVFLVLFRVEETIADYHALCELGEHKFLEAYHEVEAVSDDSFHNRLVRMILYSHPSDIVRLYRLLNTS